jgi:hypothetical protein
MPGARSDRQIELGAAPSFAGTQSRSGYGRRAWRREYDLAVIRHPESDARRHRFAVSHDRPNRAQARALRIGDACAHGMASGVHPQGRMDEGILVR